MGSKEPRFFLKTYAAMLKADVAVISDTGMTSADRAGNHAVAARSDVHGTERHCLRRGPQRRLRWRGMPTPR